VVLVVGVKTVRLAMAVMLILLASLPGRLQAGKAYWVLEMSNPAGRKVEVVSTSGTEPATWQVDWVNYAKMIAGPFARREDAIVRCLEVAEHRGSYYQSYHCE